MSEKPVEDMPVSAKPTLTTSVFYRMLKDWSAEMLKDYDKHTMKPGGPVSTPLSGLEAWLPEEGADNSDVYFGRPASKAQDDMRRRGEENKRRGILKHGPYGSGESGYCDADCAKCKAERCGAYWGGQVPKPTYDFTALNEEYRRVELAMRYTAEQRRDGDQVYAPPRMSAADRAVASAEWSRQLREKVAAAKKRDEEKARETHYWDPEGGEW